MYDLMSRMNGKKKNTHTHHTPLMVEHLNSAFVWSVLFVCFIPFILDVRFVDVPAGVTQEEGHTGFLHLLSAVLALIFLARRIQSFLSLVNRKVEFSVVTN